MMKLLLDTETLNINCKMADVQEVFLDQPLPTDHAEDIKNRNICNGNSEVIEEKEQNGIVTEHNGNVETDDGRVETKEEIEDTQQIADKKNDSEDLVKSEESKQISTKGDPEYKAGLSCLLREVNMSNSEEKHRENPEETAKSPVTQNDNHTSKDKLIEESKVKIESEEHLQAAANSTTQNVQSDPKITVTETEQNNENRNSAAEEMQATEPVKINNSVNKEHEPMLIDEIVQSEETDISMGTNDDVTSMDKNNDFKNEVAEIQFECINSETDKSQLEDKIKKCELTDTAIEGLEIPMEIDVSSDCNISNNIAEIVNAPTTLEVTSNCTTTIDTTDIKQVTTPLETSESTTNGLKDDVIESATPVVTSNCNVTNKNTDDVIEPPKLQGPPDCTVASKTTDEVNETVTLPVTSECATTNNNSDDVIESTTAADPSEPTAVKTTDDAIQSTISQVSSECTSDDVIDSTKTSKSLNSTTNETSVDVIESTNNTLNETTADDSSKLPMSSDCITGKKSDDIINTATLVVSSESSTNKPADDTMDSTTLIGAAGNTNTDKTTDDVESTTLTKSTEEVTNTTEDLYQLFECKKPKVNREKVKTSDKPEEIVEIDCAEKDQVIDVDSSDKDSIMKEDGALDTIYNCEDSSDGCTVVETKTQATPDTQDVNLDKPLKDTKNKNEISYKASDSPKVTVASRTISGLSNTLDIISDDEDETPTKAVSETAKENSNTEQSPAVDNKCINLDDDDDIMVIDEEVTKDDTNEKAKTKEEDEKSAENVEIKEVSETSMAEEDNKAASILEVLLSSDGTKTAPRTPEREIEKPEINEKTEERSVTKPPIDTKPLVPTDFLKSFKTNIAEMTRDELEEFCLVKIVEGIVEKSNLSDIKAKLKTMAQNNEDWRKKAMMLTKQNRDLQIVLKAVQEEQKRNPNSPITPLKITRSVGMQVFMTEANERGVNVAKRGRATISGPKPKVPAANSWMTKSNNNAQIPVPRLVPATASSPAKTRSVTQVQSSAISSNTGKASPANAVKTQPVKGAEKRSFNSGMSFTVDLTDDEPPAKQMPQRQAPVRLVSQQHLMGPRAQVNSVNSPRKVYIPINSQNQNQLVRPGNTIMLKSVAQPPGIRHRPPMVRLPTNNPTAIRAIRPTGRHPAPLPDVAKQQQPPNWKALPPSPDLKISKVENGIVISWKIEGYQEDSYEEIASYQLYAYQETASPPSTLLWKKIGDVKALPLPMACTLTQFMAGFKYYFAVRAVDIRSRIGPFSLPGSILLLNK